MKPCWGALLARQFSPAASFFLASCAASPPPENPQPPAPTAPVSPPELPSPVPLPDPPGASPGLGALEVVGAREAGSSLSLQRERLVPFGLGVLAVGGLPGRKDGAAPQCFLPPADGASCDLLRVARWKTPTPGAAFPREVLAGAVGPWSAPSRAPTGWDSFSGGVRHVYATGDGAFLDRIDENGQITRLLSGNSAGLQRMQVVETAAGLVLVGVEAGDEGIPELLIMPLAAEGQDFDPKATQSIKILPWVEGMLAMNVRPAIRGGRQATVGPWATAPVLTSEGALADEFFLLWTEAIIPPRKGGARPTKIDTPDCGGCGCLSSRLLEDASVKKKVHLMRRSFGGKILAEHILDLKPSARPEDDGIPQTRSPRLVPTPQGIEVNGQGFDRKGKPTGPGASVPPADRITASPPIEGVTLQTLEGAGFDKGSGQGVVILTEGGWLGAARFDGLGRRVGGLSWVQRASIPPLSGEAVRSGDRWLSLDHTRHRVVVLAGVDQGKVIPVGTPPEKAPASGFGAVVPWRGKQALVVRQTSQEDDADTPGALLVSGVDLDTGVATPWEPAKGWFTGEPALPRLQHVQSVRSETDGSLVLTGLFVEKNRQSWGELRRLGDGSWGEVAPISRGDTPPEVVEADKLGPRGCPFHFVSGPGRVVLACSEPVGPEKPSARVGLRVLRLP